MVSLNFGDVGPLPHVIMGENPFRLSGHLGPLTDLPAFSCLMIKWCSMHILNLGVSLWVCGSVMKSMIEDYDFWGDRSNVSGDDLLALAYERFRSWARERKIAPLVFS